MQLFLSLLICAFAHAETLRISAETELYQAPDEFSRVLLFVHKGEVLETVSSPSASEEYVRVRLTRGAKVLFGYVQKTSVISENSAHAFAVGLQGSYINLSEQGKTFTDADQVQYTTSAYKSVGFEPFLLAQFRERNFYRLEIGYLKTNYTSTAFQNISGAQAQPLVLQQTLLVLIAEKTWTLFGSKDYYFGLGAELARGTAVSLTLNGSPIATTSEDLPFYIGALGLLGAQRTLTSSFSAFVEARATVIANQNPFILGLDVSLGLLYWP